MKFTKHPSNPVLDSCPGAIDSLHVYEPYVLLLEGTYHLWYGGRDGKRDEICHATSPDGINWNRYRNNPVVTVGDEPSHWEYYKVTRPTVVFKDGIFHMWYSSVEYLSPAFGQGAKTVLSKLSATDERIQAARIGYATSADGINWRKSPENPVLVPSEPWEKFSLQCPNVIYEDGIFKMWYCGGQRHEPDAVGYATSPDGIKWQKHPSNPIFTGQGGWEGHKIGPLAVRHVGDTYYAFYNAMDDHDKGDGVGYSRIGMARSPDGITQWERHPDNPLIDLGPRGSWDDHSVYRACPLLSENKWSLWYNAARSTDRKETIGLAKSDSVW